MKTNFVKGEMSTLLNTLTEQFQTINQHKGKIPLIELDIFMKNTQNLYENIVSLKSINDSHKFVKTNTERQKNITAVEPQLNEAFDDEATALDLEKEEPGYNATEAIPHKETAPLFKKSEEKIEEVVEEEVSQEADLKESTAESIKFPSNIEASFDDILEETKKETDLFSNIKASQEILDLNKKLAEARGNHSLAEKLQNQQIESLKSVIGINEKFYFTNELFDGDAQKYEDVIYILNNFKKLDDAMQYFSTLKYRFNWNEESEAAEKLVHMLERKFDLINA